MRGSTRAALSAGVAAVALAAAGCTSSGGSGGDTDADGITVQGCTPENKFIPSNTNETCGGNVLDLVIAKLVHYNPDTAAPEMDIAESIESADNQTFTVTLKKGYKFSDGTEVKAHNFVDAWNWAANGKNGQLNSYFFEPIEGSAEVACGSKDCEADPPKAETMTGLAVVDDYTFTIKTTGKVSNLPIRLGYSVFAPLPDSFFTDDGKSFGDNPIGAGPYTLDSYEPGTAMVLKKNPDYSGEFGGQVDTITFKIYQDSDAAYKDLQADQLDFVRQLPTSALAGEKFKTDLPDRNLVKTTGSIATITFAPSAIDNSFDNTDLRRAISMAIDRDRIVNKVLAGTRIPADGWVPAVVDGSKAGACGEWCTYDKAKAKALFDQAGGYTNAETGNKITLAYNADGDHKAWTEATCNSITDALGVECVATAEPDFSTFRKKINADEMPGMFRTGWQMDYPSIENFLTPLYATGASSNDGDYSNPKFDQLLTEAAAAQGDSVNEFYQQAEAVLAEDMPVIPMWYGKAVAGWSTRVDNVRMTPFGVFDLASVTLK
ncbi:MAG: peptide ABC transporter substrate-binding protein [Actinomycetales bacterium]|nr:MAG: peptide ABC transporter substrate-binding protein [Actinomycetales bacterium]